MGSRGKSAGVRTLLAYRIKDRAFFVYGFAKNSHANISITELNALKRLAKELLSYSDTNLVTAGSSGALIELNEAENND